jgi:hypothetical protein
LAALTGDSFGDEAQAPTMISSEHKAALYVFIGKCFAGLLTLNSRTFQSLKMTEAAPADEDLPAAGRINPC